MKKEKASPAKRPAGTWLRRAALVLSVLLLFLCSCDKLFIPGDVPDGPSALTLTAEDGERVAEPLRYFWEKTKTEERTEREGPDPLEADYDPLVVQPGETLRFTFADQNNPKIMNLWYYEADGDGGFLEGVVLTPLEAEGDSGGEEAYLYSAPLEDGILAVEAVWPSWINSGISAEVTYAFCVYSAKG